MTRRLVYTLSLIAVIWATFAVPMPVIEVAPGAAPPIGPLVGIDESQPITQLNGSFHLLTVDLGSPSLAEVVRARLDDHRSLTSVQNVIPEGVDRDVYFEQQRRQFQLSFDVAAAVGLRAAGHEIDVRTAAAVVDVIPESPADGVLQAGDILVEVDGVQVTSSDQLIDTTRTFEMGSTVPLTVQRSDEEVMLEVTVGQTEGMDRPGLGVYITDTLLEIDLPFDVELGPTRIGGPSAGMMIAVTVYDLLADEDLARGRVIAGTGTIRLDGSVGSISGIPGKVAAAEREGADLMLVPEGLVERALEVRDTDMRIVGVSTFDEALEALRS